MRHLRQQSCQLILASLALAFLVVSAGCSDPGPERLRISGEITYDGEPVPYGDIVFTPDGAQQNSGPQGFANIVDGKYDSSASKGRGFAGGATVLQITGFSEPNGKGLLFETTMNVDLPRESSVHDIDVPKVRSSGQNSQF